MTSTFGDRLRALRQAAGLSQTTLASDQVSASYISLLEAGKREPSPEVVQYLAVRLGCSTTHLRDGHASEREQLTELEIAYARLAIEHGESADARHRLERLLEHDADALPVRVRDDVHVLLATACERTGDPPAALRLLLPLFERAEPGHLDPTHLVITELGIQLTRLHVGVGDLGRAVELGHRALALARSQRLSDTTDYYRLAATVMGAYIVRGDWATAARLCDEYLDEAVRSGEHHGQAALLWNAAVLAQKEGQLARGLGIAEKAVALLSEFDGARDFARLRLAVSGLLLAMDPPDLRRAGDFLRRCEADLQDLGTPEDLARWHALMAQVLLHEGDSPEASLRARQAVDLATKGSATLHVRVEALVALSDALTAQARDPHEPLLRALAELENASGSLTRWEAQHVRDVAERLADLGHPSAVRAYRLALQSAVVPDRSAPLRARAKALRARASAPVGSA